MRPIKYGRLVPGTKIIITLRTCVLWLGKHATRLHQQSSSVRYVDLFGVLRIYAVAHVPGLR